MAEIDYSKYSVLIVDDVPLNVLLVKKMLVRLGVQMTTATNGKEALDKVAENKPDLILLDLMMPVMDGFEVLERLKGDPQTQNIKIVVLSALNNETEIVRAMKDGAEDFIAKPIIMERLISCIKKQLEAI